MNSKSFALSQELIEKSALSFSSVEAPEHWSQVAVEMAAGKYLRKTGVPQPKQRKERSQKKPGGLTTAGSSKTKNSKVLASETSVYQMVERVVSAIASEGRKRKYLQSARSQRRYHQDLSDILLSQKAFFNSPVWFNCGLYSSYKIAGKDAHWYFDSKKKKPILEKGVYRHPQVSACFILSLEDSIEGIFDLVKTEARLFKYGSGSGSNFSTLRSKYELLSGGGLSSGLISFLEVLDRAAGSIKSGGTTRRAAKMVCVDVDHPEVLDFITWKKREEEKAKALITAGYSADFEGEAYRTVSGQNSNNSIRITDQFMQALTEQKDWELRARTDGRVVQSLPAQKIWNSIIDCAWHCADPGLQFDDTIQKWHTSPAEGRIRASNPCSEYMFLDDSACNLASLNLLKFLGEDGEFLLQDFVKTCSQIFMAQDILVDLAGYPTEKICLRSHQYRPLGLGFAGLGAFLMRKAIPYDSDEGRAWAAAVTALMHGVALQTSVEMAKNLGACEGFKKNKKQFHKIFDQHKASLAKISPHFVPGGLLSFIEDLYREVKKQSRKYGFRNSQFTVVAPTGTIGLVMDAETTGIEPEFSLIRFKKMVGGSTLKLASQSVRPALLKLGYSESEIAQILSFLEERGKLEGSPALRTEHLPIFDCAQKNSDGDRYLSALAHLKMMAAVQPFISGAISKTVNLPRSATLKDIEEVYLGAWKLGLKSIALYREGSKSSEPLTRFSTLDPIMEIKCVDCG